MSELNELISQSGQTLFQVLEELGILDLISLQQNFTNLQNQLVALSRIVDDETARINAVDIRVNNLSVDFQQIDDRINTLTNQVNIMDGRVTSVFNQLVIVSEDVYNLQNTVSQQYDALNLAIINTTSILNNFKNNLDHMFFVRGSTIDYLTLWRQDNPTIALVSNAKPIHQGHMQTNVNYLFNDNNTVRFHSGRITSNENLVYFSLYQRIVNPGNYQDIVCFNPIILNL